MSGCWPDKWWVLVLSLVLFASSTDAQVPQRLLARDAVRYLELTVEQVNALTGIQASWLDYRANAAQRSGQVEAEIEEETRGTNLDSAVLGQRYVDLETICRQSQARHLKSTVDSRALLTPAQLAKLAALEKALALMPIVQSAQSVNLLSGNLTGPPAGMPEGTIEIYFTYVRSSVVPLPGCRPSPQVVRPGVDLGGPGKRNIR